MSCEDWCRDDWADYPLYPMPPPPPPPHLEAGDLLVRGCQCGAEEEDSGEVTRSIYIVIISILSVILLLIICIFIVCCVNNR